MTISSTTPRERHNRPTTGSTTPRKASGRPATGKFSGQYEVVGDVELWPVVNAMARAKIQRADSERSDVSVTFRWGQQQLNVVRLAARVAGIPYQTYLKDVVMRQALADLRTAAAAGILAQLTDEDISVEGLPAADSPAPMTLTRPTSTVVVTGTTTSPDPTS